MNRLLRSVLVVIALLSVALLLAGCGGGGNVSGMVVGKQYVARHYDPCVSWAKVCFGGWVGPDWKLEVQASTGSVDNLKAVGVKKAAYYACAVGKHYPDCAR